MIDLHTHTTASDGTDTPAEIVLRALSAGLEALAISDHDTFVGADEAVRLDDGRMQVVRAVELSTRLAAEPDPGSRSVHILGYFFREPAPGFRAWLETLRTARHERNQAIAGRLGGLGMNVTIEEAEAIGRNITGRPHFARLLRDKGYTRTSMKPSSCIWASADPPTSSAKIRSPKKASAASWPPAASPRWPIPAV